LKVVLINPPPRRRVEQHDSCKYPHLGLAYIAAYLKNRGIEVQVIDAKLEGLGMEHVERKLVHARPDVVGITAMTHEIPQAGEVAAVAKKHIADVLTVIGGVHATALPQRTISEFPSFDVAVFGEGEITLHELIQSVSGGKSYDGIKGIAYRTPDGVRQNEPRALIANLDELPHPAWELFPPAEDYPIMTSRGCPFHCNFCMRVMGNKLRRRSARNVFAELKNIIDTYHTRNIHFLDETLTIDRERLNELLDMMLAEGLHTEIIWDAQSRSDVAEYPLFKKMRDAGCTWLGFGVESGNEKILKASGKAITLDQAEKAVKIAKKAGIKTDGYFILGHPYETKQTAMDTINFATKLNPTRITIGIMTPYPGTEIFEMATKGEGGYKLISSDWSDYNKNIGNSLEMTTLSRKDLERLQMLGYTRFYLFNLRFIAGAQYFFSQWRLGLSILKKYFFSRGGAK
jgi:anaerobic magnesium-protoporphyrin IX monomethyl ester cyclase